MKRLSAAALETLAIVAYKQPVTKGEVEAIRGVSADYAIQKLLEKELIIISGRNEKLPGHPLVYGTSKSFMDYFGINSSDELPKIKEVLAEQMIEPTSIVNGMTVNDEALLDENGNPLAVSEDGELIENTTMINETEISEEQLTAGGDELGVVETTADDEIVTDGDGAKAPGEEEVAFDDEKKQVTEEIPGSEAKDEETDEEEKKDEDDEPAY
nr:SMC-Scp complex subunit ScpB [Niabella hibiscisoli]